MCIQHGYTNLIQSEITDEGIIVSGKRGSRVLINEIREHFLVPEYPETKSSHEDKPPVGILHFIYIPNPIPKEEPTPGDINNGFMQIASEVCSPHMSNIIQVHPHIM